MADGTNAKGTGALSFSVSSVQQQSSLGTLTSTARWQDHRPTPQRTKLSFVVGLGPFPYWRLSGSLIAKVICDAADSLIYIAAMECTNGLAQYLQGLPASDRHQRRNFCRGYETGHPVPSRQGSRWPSLTCNAWPGHGDVCTVAISRRRFPNRHLSCCFASACACSDDALTTEIRHIGRRPHRSLCGRRANL